MKLEQKDQDKPTLHLVAADMAFGETFSNGNPHSLFLRVKPTGFLLNSSVIGDIINRRDLLVCNLITNTVHAFKGDTPVKLVPVHLVC